MAIEAGAKRLSIRSCAIRCAENDPGEHKRSECTVTVVRTSAGRGAGGGIMREGKHDAARWCALGSRTTCDGVNSLGSSMIISSTAVVSESSEIGVAIDEGND